MAHASLVIWHRVWEKWEKLKLHGKEQRGIIVHQPDAVSFQSLASTWALRRSLSEPVNFREIRHDQPIVAIRATLAIETIRVRAIRAIETIRAATEVIPGMWGRALREDPLGGLSVPRIVAPENPGGQLANGIWIIWDRNRSHYLLFYFFRECINAHSSYFL